MAARPDAASLVSNCNFNHILLGLTTSWHDATSLDLLLLDEEGLEDLESPAYFLLRHTRSSVDLLKSTRTSELTASNEETAGNDGITVFPPECLVVLSSLEQLLGGFNDVICQTQRVTDTSNALVGIFEVLVRFVVGQLRVGTVQFATSLTTIAEGDRGLKLRPIE